MSFLCEKDLFQMAFLSHKFFCSSNVQQLTGTPTPNTAFCCLALGNFILVLNSTLEQMNKTTIMILKLC